MMKFAQKQKGLSLLGWMVSLALVAFFASAGFKLIPHYMDYMTLEKIITKVEEDGSLNIRSVGDFYRYLEKSATVNSIRDLKLTDAIDIKQEGNTFVVHMKYEKREPLVQNLDVVANFDKEFRIKAQ